MLRIFTEFVKYLIFGLLGCCLLLLILYFIFPPEGRPETRISRRRYRNGGNNYNAIEKVKRDIDRMTVESSWRNGRPMTMEEARWQNASAYGESSY